MKKFTNYLKENLFEFLQFTMIRLDNFKGEKYEKMKSHSFQWISNKMEKKDIIIYINHSII
jgi:hypothetical protein